MSAAYVEGVGYGLMGGCLFERLSEDEHSWKDSLACSAIANLG